MSQPEPRTGEASPGPPSARLGSGVRRCVRLRFRRDVRHDGLGAPRATGVAEKEDTEDVGLEEPADLVLGELPVPRRRVSIGLLTALGALLSLDAAAGMASIAGFFRVLHRLARFDPLWIVALVASIACAFVGYRLAFDGIVWGGEVRKLNPRQRFGVVAAGFGAFVHRGGTAIDRYVMRLTGHAKRESDVRLAALQSLEMAPMSLGACTAAFVALIVGGPGHPPNGYALPWAIGPLVGAPVVLWMVHRYRRRLAHARGRGYWIGVALEGIWRLKSGLVHDRRRRVALLGMMIFTAAELFTVWAAMAAFGYHMAGSGVVLGYGVGYVVSRRSAPLGGAGLTDVMLILALAHAGAPLAVAVVGTFTYRFFNVWCWVPVSLAALSSVRRFASEP